MVQATKSLFIRVPEADARRLEQACAHRGMTKTAFVAAALRRQLDGTSVLSDRQAPPGTDDVLTLSELAALLKIDPDALRPRVESGDVPGRRFGDEWRFARSGVLSWLSSTDTPDRRAPGFDSNR